MNWDVAGILTIAGFPTCSLIAVGIFWHSMSPALVGCLLGAAFIATIGVWVAVGEGLGWWQKGTR